MGVEEVDLSALAREMLRNEREMLSNECNMDDFIEYLLNYTITGNCPLLPPRNHSRRQTDKDHHKEREYIRTMYICWLQKRFWG